MPRLLILCEYPTLLGGERSMLATLPAVAAAGFDVHVAAPPNGPLAEALAERGILTSPGTRTTRTASGCHSINSARAWPTSIGELRPALVHANSLSTAASPGRSRRNLLRRASAICATS